MSRAVVIGGGAAGMMAALTAAKRGIPVTLLERNEKLGKKVYITGKGRCNVTNDCGREEFMDNVVRNPRFLMSAISRFEPARLIAMLREMGVETKTERGKRVFPVSDKASDIIRAFTRELLRLGVDVRYNSRVSGIVLDAGSIAGVRLENGEILPCESAVLCTGGASYPVTGSTGDGYALAEAVGHRVIPLLPSLVRLETEETWPAELAGLTLKNVRLTAYLGKKAVFSDLGEMLFTHTGISGPLALSASAYFSGADLSGAAVAVDLKPGLLHEALSARVLRDFDAFKNRDFANALDELLPSALRPVIVQLSGIEPRKKVHSVTKAEREGLVALLKRLEMRVSALGPLEEAVVTRGGVDTREINATTMESKIVRGLYFAGEIIDVDALTGGFNLHIAFATGFAAGSALV